MLSDQDKKDMWHDAHDLKRKQALAESRHRSHKPMTWGEYFNFLKTTQSFFNLPSKPHKITGNHFKL